NAQWPCVCDEGGQIGNEAEEDGGKGMSTTIPPGKIESALTMALPQFQTELQIHSKMRHPHIVRFHRAFTFQSSIYVILELCPNGSVMDMVRKRKSLTLPEVRRI